MSLGTQKTGCDFYKELVANMVDLGAVGYLSKVVSLKDLEAALMARISKGAEVANKKAFRAGIKAARKIGLSTLPLCTAKEDDEL